ncbi:MAG: D-Ala-D-Ala carboxypeptidase family metallohydrolase [Nitrosomonadaceae bacterium]
MAVKFPPHFSLEELIRSQTATRNSIDNTPDEEQLNNLVGLAWFLESLRSRIVMQHGRTWINVSSGFRCEELNLIIGGSRTSSHMKGLAADITCPLLTPLELSKFIRDEMEDYDQIIHEFERWVHIGLADTPRLELLTAVKDNGKTKYKAGLV